MHLISKIQFKSRFWLSTKTVGFRINVQWVCPAEQTLWSSPSTASTTDNQQTPSNLIKITDFDWCALSSYTPYCPLPIARCPIPNAHCSLPSLNCSVSKYWRKGRHVTCRCRPSVAPIETNEAQESKGSETGKSSCNLSTPHQQHLPTMHIHTCICMYIH